MSQGKWCTDWAISPAFLCSFNKRERWSNVEIWGSQWEASDLLVLYYLPLWKLSGNQMSWDNVLPWEPWLKCLQSMVPSGEGRDSKCELVHEGSFFLKMLNLRLEAASGWECIAFPVHLHDTWGWANRKSKLSRRDHCVRLALFLFCAHWLPCFCSTYYLLTSLLFQSGCLHCTWHFTDILTDIFILNYMSDYIWLIYWRISLWLIGRYIWIIPSLSLSEMSLNLYGIGVVPIYIVDTTHTTSLLLCLVLTF